MTEIFEVLKDGILYPLKMSLKNEGKTKIFSEK